MKRTALILVMFGLGSVLTSSGTVAQVAGDANGDLIVNVGDVVFEINYLYKNGLPPVFYECGDPNGDCFVDVGDVVYLINYLYRGGSDPLLVYCNWTEPVNLGEPINSPAGEESFRMTPDGRMAVLVSNRAGSYGNGDIWYCFWDSISGSWSEPQNCGPNVNTMIQDLGPCLSPDGKKLYYVQYGRPGGYGGWEIWVSTWDSLNLEWGMPENLGPTINRTGAEWGPFVSPDGSKLYFSNGWGIWVSEWNGSSWETPVMLDTTVNGSHGEKHPSVTADNETLYFTRWGGPNLTYYMCVSQWTGTGWGTAHLLPPHVSDSGGAGQSYVTPDGSKLYFISARDGGVGSGDVWVSERIIDGDGQAPR